MQLDVVLEVMEWRWIHIYKFMDYIVLVLQLFMFSSLLIRSRFYSLPELLKFT